MKAKKQQNGNVKGGAVLKKGIVEVTTKKDRKKQSTESSPALPTKFNKKEEGPVLSAVAKSKKRKDRKKKTRAITAGAAAAVASGDVKPNNLGRINHPKDEEKEKAKQATSIAYLKLWKDDRKNWKFKKINQMWLNDNMLDRAMIPDNIFPIWLEYMVGSTDGQKLWLVKRSTEVLEELETADSSVDASDVKYQRAKKIIQTLHVGKKEESDVKGKDDSEGDEEDEDEEDEDSST